MIKIIESPREGMQGISRIIPTHEKLRYIDKLLRAGFDIVETGSLVSPKILPQMADSMEILRKLDLTGTSSGRMFLAVSSKGAEILAGLDTITHISYPFSFSPTFLKLNLNTTVEKSIETVGMVVDLCKKTGKQAVIYISMAFGNPYGDLWNSKILIQWVGELHRMGVRTIALSNVSIPLEKELISEVYSTLIPLFPNVEFGLHLHTSNDAWYEKIDAAYLAGCRRFDGVITGLGGCPMTGSELLGNVKTENLVEFAEMKGISTGIDRKILQEACDMSKEIFYE